MRLFITTIPKSGSHYLIRAAVRAHGAFAYPLERNLLKAMRDYGKDLVYQALHQFGDSIILSGHVRYAEWPEFAEALERLNFKVLVLIRDPADVVVSQRDYLAKTEDPLLQPVAEMMSGLTEAEQWNHLIEGFELDDFEQLNIVHWCSGFLEWSKHPQAAVLRYEHLLRDKHTKILLSAIGRGAVSREKVEQALRAARHDPTPTLNRAIIGRGREIPKEKISPNARKLLHRARQMLDYA